MGVVFLADKESVARLKRLELTKFANGPARCHLCDDLAVAVFDLPGGCACSKYRVQALCMQHVVKANDRAGMSLKVDLTVGQAFTRWWVEH